MRRSSGRRSRAACGRSSKAGCSPCSRVIRRSKRWCAASAAKPDNGARRKAVGCGGGEVVHGVMEAPDRAFVIERLQRQGQTVLRADPADRRRGLGELLQLEIGAARGLDKNGLAEVTRELATMLAAGQDLDRALRFIV